MTRLSLITGDAVPVMELPARPPWQCHRNRQCRRTQADDAALPGICSGAGQPPTWASA
jgi:hypothetical protein